MGLDISNLELQTATKLVRETNQSFFLTGRAGTGKSFFLKHIVKTTPKKFVVVAPTGVAAVNVGGVTIHSFFQFPLRPLLSEDEAIKKFWNNSDRKKIITAMDTLIIDEISMVRADIIDGIDYSLRINGGNPNLPFGGKQVLFIGDLFQLEPVITKNIKNNVFRNTYFYRADVFKKLELFTIELQKVYRQTDPIFISLLDKVRVMNTSRNDILKINSRILPENKLDKENFAITLTTRNKSADAVNQKRLLDLKSDLFTYRADVFGKFKSTEYPTDFELTLKEGAQVIFVRNDTHKRWVNGTIAQVYELTQESIKVKLENGAIHHLDKISWENIEYKYNAKKKKIEQEIIGTFRQYPLKLAWAITIHKSQGLTFDKVVVDFDGGTFASGQAYVALSRATSFEGLFLKNELRLTDIFVDQEIKKFAETYNNYKVIEEKLNTGKQIFKFHNNHNLESIGEFYFKEAINNIINGDFKLSYNYLLLGFDYVSCDCFLVKELRDKKDKVLESLYNNPINCTLTSMDFIRAVIYFFSDSGAFNREQEGSFKKALPFINSYLERYPNSEIGHYIKGRVLSSSKDIKKAISEFKIALQIKKTSRTLYRIGRIKEQNLQQFGVNYLYDSVLLNPSSICTLRWFKDSCDTHRIKLITNPHKLLSNYFNNKSTDTFTMAVYILLLKGSVELDNKRLLHVTDALKEFTNTLKSDKHLFKLQQSNRTFEF